MPLYEYFCEPCQIKFEQIQSVAHSSDSAECPRCHGKRARKLISRFAIGGQGDLRETTQHGCHEAHVGLSSEGHDDHED